MIQCPSSDGAWPDVLLSLQGSRQTLNYKYRKAKPSRGSLRQWWSWRWQYLLMNPIITAGQLVDVSPLTHSIEFLYVEFSKRENSSSWSSSRPKGNPFLVDRWTCCRTTPIALSSPPPKTCEWLARICSQSEVPDRGRPKIKIGWSDVFPLEDTGVSK